jgi:hypothetical protein
MGICASSRTLDDCFKSQLAAKHLKVVTEFFHKVNAGYVLVSVKMDNLNKTGYSVVPSQYKQQGSVAATLTNMFRVIDVRGGLLRQDSERPPINTDMRGGILDRVQHIIDGRDCLDWDSLLVVNGMEIVDEKENPRLHSFTTLGSLPGQSSSFRLWCEFITKGLLVVSRNSTANK